MTTLNLNKLLIFLLLFCLGAIFFRFFNILSFSDSSILLEKGDEVKLEAGTALSQKFTANRDGLSKIQFLLRTPRVKPENVVEMKLADENCQETIREGKLEYAFLSSDNLYEFKFEKIPDSENKAYCVLAKFKPKKENAKKPVFFTKKNSQDLSIRPAYNNENVFQDLGELNERISQYKPWFLKHYFLWLITIFFLMLTVALIAILIIL